MREQDYKQMADQERMNFWHVGRREILQEVLDRYLENKKNNEILEIGCGTGGNSLFLGCFGNVTGIDSSNVSIEFARKYDFSRLVQEDASSLSFLGNEFDLVAGLDVLEHIQDDETAIKETFRVLKQGGFFLITVPAYKFLWSHHDQALYHHRRYSKKELFAKLQAAGFQIVAHNRFAMLGVPFHFMHKIKEKIMHRKNIEQVLKTHNVNHHAIINKLLLWILRLEKYLIRYIRLPFGTSILVVAKKNR